jgi:hypothetical protein
LQRKDLSPLAQDGLDPGIEDIALPTYKQRLTVDDFRLCIDGKSSGAVRVSVGMVTNFNDVQAFLEFSRGLLG